MKYSLFIFLILFSSQHVFSQAWEFKRPDYKQIEIEIAEQASEFNYKKLFSQYQSADTTMSLEAKRHLYYGYTFHPDYSPYGSSDYRDSINLVFENESLLPADYEKIIRFSDSLLAFNPFDLKAINYKSYCYEALQNETEYNHSINKMSIIFDAIMSSGDGIADTTAFYVINTSHEYALVDILGFEFGGSQSLKGYNDYLTLAENELEIKGLYFDVSPCLNHLNKQFKQPVKSKRKNKRK